MIQAKCKEKAGTVTRTAYILPRNPWIIREVVRNMRSVPNFLGKEDPYDVFTRPNTLALLVDDIGIIYLKPVGKGIEAHITFWDGRLRGRETLCREIAKRILKKFEFLYTAIPAESRFVRAFTERIGFELQAESKGTAVYVMRS